MTGKPTRAPIGSPKAPKVLERSYSSAETPGTRKAREILATAKDALKRRPPLRKAAP